ncbi:DMT family transporter [Actinokineospora fastidiosa]|nr:DMT family transporter [Actinokineospora fastidiosa]
MHGCRAARYPGGMAVGNSNGSRAVAYALMAGGMALFGSATPVSRLVGEAFPAMLASGLRMLTAVVVLVPLLVVRRRTDWPGERLGVRDRWLLAGIAVVGTFGFTVLLFLGMRQAPGAVGAVVMAMTPAVTAVGAVLFLSDRINRWSAMGLALAVCGVLVVNLGGAVGGQGENVWLGSVLVFGAVCCEATYTLLGKKLTAGLTPLAISAVAAVGAGLLFAPFAVVDALSFDWGVPSGADWLAVLWWGAATMGVGSVLWFSGMRRSSGATASGFMAVMPVSALLLSYVLLGESFHWSHVVGIAAVLLGLAAVIRSDQSAREER